MLGNLLKPEFDELIQARDWNSLREAFTEMDPADVAEHFGWIGRFFSGDYRASSAPTRELLGWEPTGLSLLEDLDQGHYFAAPAA